MGRSGYSEDYDGDFPIELYRGTVARATRGKRGQRFFRDLLAALDVMPVRRLAANVLEEPDGVCAAATYQAGLSPMLSPCTMGALGQARGTDMSWFDPEWAEDDPISTSRKLGRDFDIAYQLASEVEYMNDEAGIGLKVKDNSRRGYSYQPETPEQRWTRMRAWVASNVNDEPPKATPS